MKKETPTKTTSSIYNKFQFIYLAIDNERTAQGEVVPGIGGMVYDRLGFEGQARKNSYTPNIVKTQSARVVANV